MPVELVEKMLTGDQRALARLVSAVERQSADVPAIMQRITPRLGGGYCVGITGPPGAGKSTITDRLTAYVRQQGKTVGIIAVDPTSPFSGGAILGDRIRMQQHYLDAGVYIRSMASRGHHGGLSRAAKGVIKLLDASGKDLIIVETVGVGQTELDIVAAADTTLLILVPESGDAIQTIKAGIMEIADLFVINKADRDGAERLQRDLQMMLHVRHASDGWCPAVLSTRAHQDIGIAELCEAIESHRCKLSETGQLAARRQQNRRQELLDLLQQQLMATLTAQFEDGEAHSGLLEQVEEGVVDPYTAAQQMLVESRGQRPLTGP
jgi:LAO/AO transport system kinase